MACPRSPDGSKLYPGYGVLSANGMSAADRFRIFETGTLEKSGEFWTSAPFWSVAISSDGAWIYAAVPALGRVLVLEAAAGREQRSIVAGKTPALALVAR